MLHVLAQVEGAIEGVAKVAEGRGDSFVLLIIAVGLIGFTMWRDGKRTDVREAHQRDMDTKNAASLELISSSTQTSGLATEKIGMAMEKHDGKLDVLLDYLQRERQANLAIIESMEAIAEDDAERSKRKLTEARNILMLGRTSDS